MVVTLTSRGQQRPYAVFSKLPEGASVIEKLVTRNLGSKYAIGGAMDLGKLGMVGWPRTIAGKISVKDVEHAVANQENV